MEPWAAFNFKCYCSDFRIRKYVVWFNDESHLFFFFGLGQEVRCLLFDGILEKAKPEVVIGLSCWSVQCGNAKEHKLWRFVYVDVALSSFC